MPKTKNTPGIHLHKTEHYTGGVEVTWYWNIIASNGREICRSSETYTRKANAVKSMKAAKELFRKYWCGYYDHSQADSPLKRYL